MRGGGETLRICAVLLLFFVSPCVAQNIQYVEPFRHQVGCGHVTQSQTVGERNVHVVVATC